MEISAALAAVLALALIALVAAAVALTRLRARGEETARLAAALAEAERRHAEASERVALALADKASAETAAAAAREETARLTLQLQGAIDQREKAQARANETETRRALAEQELTAMHARVADWEKSKEEANANARTAMLEMSAKLVEAHRRETELAKTESEERVKKAAEALTQRFEAVSQHLASLNDVVAVNQKTVDTVWAALSNPGGAGYFAEIGLENTLKSFGLEPGRDFVMQFTVHDNDGGRKLRPDAIVFLPAESVLVIDSKASKFVLDLAGAETPEAEAEARARLAQTMNTHVRALAAKDYRAAILKSWADAGRASEIRRILNVMYLPNEGVLERLRATDGEFDRRCAREQIVPVGPAGLAGLVGFARLDIDYGRQLENQEQIVEASRRLVEAVVVALGHADRVGKNLRSAADGFAELAGSINKRLLPRARALEKLGVRVPKGKGLPAQVPAYQLVDLSQPTIEGEAEEVGEAADVPAALP